MTTSAPVAPTQQAGTFQSAFRSEWITLRTSTPSTALIVVSVGGMVAVSVLSAAALMAGYDGPSELVNAQSVQGLPTVGLYLGQLVLAALAVLLVTARNTRPTLTAAPRRMPALFAAGLLAALVGAAVGVLGRLISYVAIQPILAQHHLDFALGSAEFWTSMGGVALHFALIAVMAVGIGSLLRTRAAGILAVIGLLLVAPMTLWLIPGDVAARLVDYLPSEAGTQLLLAEVLPGDLTHLQSGLILAVWAFVPFALALWRVRRNEG